MKKALTAIAAAILAALGLCAAASAEQFTEGFYTYTVENGEATITRITGEHPDGDGNLVIPSELGGCPVTAIGDSACTHRGLDQAVKTHYVLPETLTTVEPYAFYYNKNITGLTVQSNLETVGTQAFAGVSVEELIIGDQVTDFKLGLPHKPSKRAVIGKNITEIPDKFFEYSEFDEITFRGAPVRIGSRAFYGCTALSRLELGDKLTYIGSEAFSGLTETEITLDSSNVTEIGYDAFRNCAKLSGELDLRGLEKIESGVFKGCAGLSRLELGDKLTYIGDEAFSGLTETEITLDSSNVTEIGYEAFKDCAGLSGELDLRGLEKVENGAFMGCMGLSRAELGYGLTSIGENAFYGCLALESAHIPDSAYSVGDMAFALCPSLSDVTLPRGLAEIPSGLFLGCASLTEIQIPNTVTNIRYMAFAGTGLERVTLPSALESLSNLVFYGCDSLDYIDIKGNPYYSSEDGVIYYTSGGSKVLGVYPPGRTGKFTVPAGVGYIFNGAFATSSLTSLTVPSTVMSIGELAFADSDMTVYVYSGSVAENYLLTYPDEADYFVVNGERRGLFLNRFSAGSAGVRVSVMNDTSRAMDCGTLYVAQMCGDRVLRVDAFDCGTVYRQGKQVFRVTDMEPEADSAAVYLWDDVLRPLTDCCRALPSDASAQQAGQGEQTLDKFAAQ